MSSPSNATTTQAIVIETFGGPENMRLQERALGQPGPGEIRIRHRQCTELKPHPPCKPSTDGACRGWGHVARCALG